MQVDLYITTVLKLAAMMKLTAGIYAIQAPEVPLTVNRAAEYAVAATYHGERAGIDPYELVAIARNESDFVEESARPRRQRLRPVTDARDHHQVFLQVSCRAPTGSASKRPPAR